MKTNCEKPPTTWYDIENNLKNMKNIPIETNDENLNYFKNKIIEHLDNLQAEEDKKIITFPKNAELSPN